MEDEGDPGQAVPVVADLRENDPAVPFAADDCFLPDNFFHHVDLADLGPDDLGAVALSDVVDDPGGRKVSDNSMVAGFPLGGGFEDRSGGQGEGQFFTDGETAVGDNGEAVGVGVDDEADIGFFGLDVRGELGDIFRDRFRVVREGEQDVAIDRVDDAA